jgi:flagellar biosynthesis protein FliQ
VNWDWIWITCPLWAGIALFLAIIVVAFVVGIIAGIISAIIQLLS